MRIAIVSKSNAQGGGASRIAEDTASWLIKAGHSVDHFCAFPGELPKPFQKPFYPGGFSGRICRGIHSRARNRGFNEMFPVEYFWVRHTLGNYDAVHFHDHYTAYSLATAGLISKKTKVFFTAHDCLHFTGDRPYPPVAGEASNGVASIPARLSQGVNRFVAEHYAVTYIYPSKWLCELAQEHLRFSCEPVVLPNGFDPSPYDYQPRSDARRELGLVENRPIICVAAHYLGDPRKGVRYALQAISSVRDLNPLILLLGNPIPNVEATFPGLQFWFTGYVESRNRMGLLFAAADVFLTCPLLDNLPISVQESMGAATPIVGFATGGIPEMIEDGTTGWLVPTGNQEALNAVLREALVSGTAEERGMLAQTELRTRFSKEQSVQSHLQLYSRTTPETLNVQEVNSIV